MEKFLVKSAADKSQNKARVECCPRMEESCLAVEHSQRSTRTFCFVMHDLCCTTRTSYTTTVQVPKSAAISAIYHNNPAIFDKIRNIARNLWHFTSQLFPRYFRNVSASFWRDRYMAGKITFVHSVVCTRGSR